MLKIIKQIVSIFKPKTHGFHSRREHQEFQSSREKIQTHTMRFMVLLLLIGASGCSDDYWAKNEEGPFEPLFPTEQSDPKNPLGPFDQPNPPSASDIEAISKLPSVIVSFDTAYKSIKEEDSIWVFTTNKKDEFYSRGQLKISRFHISNHSNQDLQIKPHSVTLKGHLRQYLNKFSTKSTSSVSSIQLFSNIKPKDLDLSSYLTVTFENGFLTLEDQSSYTLKKGESLSGYLTVDLSRVPTCYLHSDNSWNKDGWHIYETFSVLRVDMNFDISFEIKKSLADKPDAFYEHTEAWALDYSLDPQHYSIRSDLSNSVVESLYEFHNNEEYLKALEEPMEEFSCDGLYITPKKETL